MTSCKIVSFVTETSYWCVLRLCSCKYAKCSTYTLHDWLLKLTLFEHCILKSKTNLLIKLLQKIIYFSLFMTKFKVMSNKEYINIYIWNNTRMTPNIFLTVLWNFLGPKSYSAVFYWYLTVFHLKSTKCFPNTRSN